MRLKKKVEPKMEEKVEIAFVGKRQFAEKMKEIHGVTVKKGLDMYDAVFSVLCLLLEEGNSVSIGNGLGVFRQKVSKPRRGRNPRTGEPVDVPKKLKLSFKESILLRANRQKNFKESTNN